MDKKGIGKKRIKVLVEESKKRPKKSSRYYEIIHKISQKTKTPITQTVRKLYCPKCKHVKTPLAWKVRLKKGKMTTTCLKCGYEKKISYK